MKYIISFLLILGWNFAIAQNPPNSTAAQRPSANVKLQAKDTLSKTTQQKRAEYRKMKDVTPGSPIGTGGAGGGDMSGSPAASAISPQELVNPDKIKKTSKEVRENKRAKYNGPKNVTPGSPIGTGGAGGGGMTGSPKNSAIKTSLQKSKTEPGNFHYINPDSVTYINPTDTTGR